MDRAHHLKFCKICTLRKKNFEKGLVCSLTDELASFEDSCPDFKKDIEEDKREFERQMTAAGGYQERNPTSYKSTMNKGALWFIGGLFLTLATHLFIEKIRFAVISYGAMIYGAATYLNGLEQKKLYEERFNNEDHEE